MTTNNNNNTTNNNTFHSILQFMQHEDHNGEWMDATMEECPYILDTLRFWLSDGLEMTPRVQRYVTWLESQVK